MCKHVLNAQVSIRTPCCSKWYDCPKCHEENEKHPLNKTTEMIFACKKCKKVFRKDMSQYEESDEYCPRCDNHYVIDAVTPETKSIQEGKGHLVVGIDGVANNNSKGINNSDNMKEEILKQLLAEDDSELFS